METIVILTFDMKQKDGKTCTCNMAHGLDTTLEEIKARFDDLKEKGYVPSGNIVLNFVSADL